MCDTLLKKIQMRAHDSDSDVVYITRKGEVLLDWTSEPNLPPIEIMSITKSIVALAVGMLIEEGKIPDVDIPVFHIYPEWHQGEKQKITLRMIMNHTSGLQTIPSGNQISQAPDGVKLALCAELEHRPGEKFFYNNKAVNLLAGIVERVAGQPLDEYVKRKIFAPLGIDEFGWNHDDAGNPRSSGGVQMHAKDLHKIAELVMNGGFWDSIKLLGNRWLEQMLTPSQVSGNRCGLLWWIYSQPQIYAAQGYLGQWLYILPEKRIIAIRQMRKGKRPLDQVDEYKDFREWVAQL